jgi:hypothetical protein
MVSWYARHVTAASCIKHFFARMDFAREKFGHLNPYPRIKSRKNCSCQHYVISLCER